MASNLKSLQHVLAVLSYSHRSRRALLRLSSDTLSPEGEQQGNTGAGWYCRRKLLRTFLGSQEHSGGPVNDSHCQQVGSLLVKLILCWLLGGNSKYLQLPEVVWSCWCSVVGNLVE